MKNIFPILLALIFFSACSKKQTYDIILRNGTVYDGSGMEPFVADVAIHKDTIAAIGDLIDAIGVFETDVTGLAVAPGFINMLSWSNESLIEDGRSQGEIRQGVTLEILGEGWSMGPLNDAMKQEMIDDQVDITYDIEWSTLGEYLEYLQRKGVSCNVASFVGNGGVKQYVMDYENRPPTEEELEKMKNLVREAMEEGAVGLSSALIYQPSSHASNEELIELARVAKEYNGMYITHIRSEEAGLVDAVKEVIYITQETGIRSEIYHFKASGMDNWDKLDEAIAVIENAQSEGLNITTDMYMYPASSTGLNVVMPMWSREGGIDKTIEMFEDPELRKKIREEIEFHIPPEKILLVGFKNEEMRHYIGKNLQEAADERGEDPRDAVINMIKEDDSRIQVVYFSMSEENVKKKIALPYMAFCSDASSMTNEGVFLKQSTHPRAYGSFARLLGKYVREEKVIPLEEAIRRLTSFPAANLKIEKRGSLKPGFYADVVVFDPNKIIDKATFTDPHQYAVGMVHVFVNGGQVIKDGEHTGAKPGRVVRGPGYKD
jgi:N-acyl-D-amino-acid deacylase